MPVEALLDPFWRGLQEERIDALMRKLREDPTEYDIIGFQEMFIPHAVSTLKEQLPLAGFKHVIHFSSGVHMPQSGIGSGCLIASRYPILDSAWHTFSAGGKPYRFDQWDWHVGKGIGLARILLPGDFGTADVYVAHLQAQYHDAPHDSYHEQRALQAWEAAMFIRTTRRSDLTLFLADLNSGPDTLVYRMLANLAGFKDAYSCTHTKEDGLLHGGTLNETRSNVHSLVTPRLDASRVARSIYDSTFGSHKNVFSAAFGSSPGEKIGAPSCDVNARLDYVLFGTGSVAWPFTVAPFSVNLFHRTWHVLNSDIRLTEHITLANGKNINYSDHSAVFAELACVLIAPEPGQSDAASMDPRTSVSASDQEDVGLSVAPTLQHPPGLPDTRPPGSTGEITSPSSEQSGSEAPAAETGGVARRSASTDATTGRDVSSANSMAAFEAEAHARTAQQPLRRVVSDGEISNATRRGANRTEKMLREAIEAAGVPLERCANLPPEMQQALSGGSPRPRNEVIAKPRQVESLRTASHGRTRTRSNVVPGMEFPSGLENADPAYMKPLLDAASAASGTIHPKETAMEFSWRQVLLETLACMENGNKQSGDLFRTQILSANAILAFAMLLVLMLGWMGGRGTTTPFAAFHAILFTAGFTWAYMLIIRMGSLRSVITAVVGLVSVGVAVTSMLWEHLGWQGLVTSFACGMSPLAILLVWVAVMMTSAEQRAYQRAIQQIQVLLQRPPAVVA